MEETSLPWEHTLPQQDKTEKLCPAASLGGALCLQTQRSLPPEPWLPLIISLNPGQELSDSLFLLPGLRGSSPRNCSPIMAARAPGGRWPVRDAGGSVRPARAQPAASSLGKAHLWVSVPGTYCTRSQDRARETTQHDTAKWTLSSRGTHSPGPNTSSGALNLIPMPGDSMATGTHSPRGAVQ